MRVLLATLFSIVHGLNAAGAADDLRAVTYFLRGLAIRETAGCAAAIPHFEIALRHASDYSTAWLELARCKGKLGSQSGRIAALKKLVAADSQNAHAWSELGLALHLAGDMAGALRSLENLARIDKAAAEALQLTIWL